MQITFCNDHVNHPNQLYIALSGDPAAIKEALYRIATQMDDFLPDFHGKPCQGIVVRHNVTSHVITPQWGGKAY